MIKKLRIYQISLIAVSMLCIGLLAFMGITAIQKSMTLNLQFNSEPAVSCEFAIRQANSTLESDFDVIFKNYDNSEIGDGTSLSGNTLIFESDKYDNFTGSAIDIKFTNKTTECSAIKLSVLNVTVGGNTGYSVFIPQNGVQVIEDISCPAGEDVVFQMEYVAEITFNLSYAQVSSVNGLTLKTGSTYYAVYGTTPSATLTATQNHMNPPQGVEIPNNLGSYSNGIINFEPISQDVSITVANTSMQTYAVVEELTNITDVSYAISPTHGQNFTFTVTIDEDCTQVKVSYKIGNGEYATLNNPTPSEGVYTYTIAGANITGVVTIKAEGLSSYTITYNANGGSFANSETTSSVSVTAGSNYTLPTPPTRTEHNFLGWADESSDTSPDWETGSQPCNSDKTWYAVWELKTYTLALLSEYVAPSYYEVNTGFGVIVTNDDGFALTWNDPTPPANPGFYTWSSGGNSGTLSTSQTIKSQCPALEYEYVEYYNDTTDSEVTHTMHIPYGYKVMIFNLGLHIGAGTFFFTINTQQSVGVKPTTYSNIKGCYFTMPNDYCKIVFTSRYYQGGGAD